MIEMEEIQGVVREAAKFFTDRAAVGMIREKGLYDYVTAVDEVVQQYMQEKLEALYPDIQFMGEEKDNSTIDMRGDVWVLDPVDGTTNLVHDYRNSAISLALISNREVIFGIIYNPFSDEMYYAKKGNGSFLNGEKIHVSDAKAMEESLISIGTSPYFKDEAQKNFQIFSQIFRDCQDIRRCGSASLDLAHVACGRIDGYVENHLKLWDYAAGVLIVREAGGKVLNYEGQELPMELDGNVVAGNSLIPKIIVEQYLDETRGKYDRSFI